MRKANSSYKIHIALLLMLALLMPHSAHAESLGGLFSILQAIFTQGQSLLTQTMNNGAIDASANRLNNETMRHIADFQAQNDYERDRKLHKAKIVENHDTVSNTGCAIATANQSVPGIQVASENAVSTLIDILTNGLYYSPLTGTPIGDKKMADIWCKLGAIGQREGCTTALDPLVAGADKNAHAAITRKVSIPCDMPGVVQELQNMAADGWTPNARHKECLAAVLSIAGEFERSNALPTAKQQETMSGVTINSLKKAGIAQLWASKGSVLQQFGDRVSVSKSMMSTCDKGIRGGGEDMYSLLQEVYQGTTRLNKVAPFGLPPSDFCLSNYQIRQGTGLLLDRALATNVDASLEQQINMLNAISIATYLSNNARIRDVASSVARDTYPNMLNGDTAPRSIGPGTPSAPAATPYTNIDPAQQQLLGAIRELTKEMKEMNKGAFADRAQEVRLKKKANETTADVQDALKEMGLKVSTKNPAILPPITPAFPTVP
ncbi:MAG: hypothetical protein EB059_04255 [Alphaproteobacteria bacterium]|nr:hypothetical protein [Alphaproteobacteria bacterium]